MEKYQFFETLCNSSKKSDEFVTPRKTNRNSLTTQTRKSFEAEYFSIENSAKDESENNFKSEEKNNEVKLDFFFKLI